MKAFFQRYLLRNRVTQVVVLMLAALLLSSCDVLCDVIPLPSCFNVPTPSVPTRVTAAPMRTFTPYRTSTGVSRTNTPVRTSTPALSSSVSKVKTIFVSNPSIESNLDTLSSQLSTLSSALSSLDSAKTALAVIDKIKSQTCVVTNCWTALITALDAVASGSGSALSQLDSLLRQAIAFKSKVDAVGSLSSLRSSASTFRSNSTDSTLSSLMSNLNSKLPALRTLNQDFSSLKTYLNSINSGISLVSQALRTAKTLGNIPYVNDLTNAVEKVRAAASTAYSAVNSIISPLSLSVSTMESILSASK